MEKYGRIYTFINTSTTFINYLSLLAFVIQHFGIASKISLLDFICPKFFFKLIYLSK